jgi:hypothetical protein
MDVFPMVVMPARSEDPAPPPVMPMPPEYAWAPRSVSKFGRSGENAA